VNVTVDSAIVDPPSNAPLQPSEVRADREGFGMSQQAFADALGVVKTTIGRWERGEREIESPRLYRWAIYGMRRAFGIPGRRAQPPPDDAELAIAATVQ